MRRRAVWHGALGRFINVSSLHVWEPARGERPTNAYEASKLSAELLLGAFSARHGFEAANLRLGYLYGPGMVHGKLFRVFIRNALAGRPLELFHEGRQELQLIFVDDAVEAILAASSAGELHGTFDICAPERVTTLDVARAILDITGSGSELRFHAGDHDQARRLPDTRAAREAFGFEAQTGLRQGLEAMLAEQQERDE